MQRKDEQRLERYKRDKLDIVRDEIKHKSYLYSFAEICIQSIKYCMYYGIIYDEVELYNSIYTELKNNNYMVRGME